MIGLASSTKIRKIIPKKKIYEKFDKEINKNRKESFNKEISRITITNEISPYSLNIEEGKEVKSIFVIKIDLGDKVITDANISMLSRYFGQNILFLLVYEDEAKLAIYQKRLLQTEYKKFEEIEIKLEGLNLDTIWDNLILSIPGYKLEKGNTLDEQIRIEEEKNKLIKQIEKLDKQARSESQPKKSFEFYQQMVKIKKRLEEL